MVLAAVLTVVGIGELAEVLDVVAERLATGLYAIARYFDHLAVTGQQSLPSSSSLLEWLALGLHC